MPNRANVRTSLCRALAAAILLAATTAADSVCAQFSVDIVRAEDPQTDRTEAERELEMSRRAVADARAEATAAKRALEAAVAASTTDETPDGGSAQPGSGAREDEQSAGQPGDRRSWASALAEAHSSEIEALRRLIAELKAERRQLLTYLTSRHPLIIDANFRIKEYEQQLDTLAREGVSGKSAERPEGMNLAAPNGPPATAPRNAGPAARQQAAIRLDEALVKWEQAQRQLEAAMDAESSAAGRLAELAAKRPVAVTDVAVIAPEPDPPAPDNVVRTSDVSASEGSKASQPVVLALLILALVVAAVASVKLARASDDTLFAGADDAAAALSLPVVGVIPATTHAVARGTFLQRYRTLAFALQMLLAIAVFAVVAYIVQSPVLRF